MGEITNFVMNTVSLAVVAGIVAFGARAGWRLSQNVMGAEQKKTVVREAHTDRGLVAQQGIVQNRGDLERVSTNRGIQYGRFVGQTLPSYGSGGDDYLMALRTTTTNGTIGQNFAGSAFQNG